MRYFIFALALIATTAYSQNFLGLDSLADQPELSKFNCLQGLKGDAAFIKSMLNKFDQQGTAGLVSYLPFIQSWSSQTQQDLKECMNSKDLISSMIQLSIKNQTICQDQIRIFADKLNVVTKALKSGNITYAMQHFAEAGQAFIELFKACTGSAIEDLPFNVTNCIGETKVTVGKVATVYQKYANGTYGLHDMLAALNEILKSLPTVVDSCGGKETKAYLDKELSGLVSATCEEDLNNVLALIESLMKNGIPENPLDIIGDLGKVRTLLFKLAKDCTARNSTNTTALMSNFMARLENFKENKEIRSEAIKLMEELVSQHPEATILAVQKYQSLSSVTCKQAAENLLALGKKFVNDYANGSTVALTEDLAQMFPVLKDLISACV